MRFLLSAFLSLAFAAHAMAQQPAPRPADPVAHANQGVVGIITGMEGGTYARTGADLTILDDGTLRVLPTLGKGSLQNLSDILYLRGVDIGFVQADALTYATQHAMFPNLAQAIRYIAKLFDEEVHVLGRRDIASLQDLNGQKVNADVIGSGSAMTAGILLDAFGIKAEVGHDKQVNAVQALRNGDIAAVIQVGGAPMPLFADIPADSGLHLLPVPINPALAKTYLPAEFTHDAYPRLVAGDAAVPTLAVGSVLAVYSWPPSTERYARVTRFVNAFFSRFDEFQQPPRHPKWREVNLTAEVPGWTRFQPAQDWLVRQTLAGKANAATQARFNTFLTQAAPGVGGTLTDAAKEVLFEQFLAWDKAHSAMR